MKKYSIPALLAVMLLCLNSCAIIGGIFKAGAAVGIIAVIIVLAILIWIISLFRGKN